MYKKIISAALAAALTLGAACVPGSANAAEAARGDKVKVIVETEGTPLLQMKNAARMGAAEFMKTDEARETGLRLMSAQEEIKKDIERRIRADLDSGFTYTSVINGFSMEAYESDIEKIKSIDGVKNVYISPILTIPEDPDTDVKGEPSFGAQMMNAQAMYDSGYDGRGQAVAIIDAGFDTSHEFFSSPIPDPKLSKNDIRDFIDNNELNVDVEVNQVYKSEKIPFAYDYADNDADTYSLDNAHGSHIAGIAAGKNGVYGGTTFSGVAPQAQLILMKTIDGDGRISFDIIMAAMDDASKMDICAVNMSLGDICAEIPLFEKATNNLRNAGIAVIVSAGNYDRSYETVENLDYAFYDLPSSYSAATSVASIDASKKWSFSGKITLGNGEELITSVYNKLFFEKFSDKPYDYVYTTVEQGSDSVDLNGKIVVTSIIGGISSAESLSRGAVGIIAISDNETDREVITISDDIPGIIVRKSYGEKLIASESKTLQTAAEPNVFREDVPDAGMSVFTSWGTGTPLELKPEITAPGGGILSSMNNDIYETRSGTSMAAPQITGAIALMNGFVGGKYPDVTGSDKVALMENLMMSSARIIFQDSEKTLPESPRRQGAGLADLSSAMSVPVILKGDSGKSKLSLKDMLTDEIPLKFTAKNLTDSDVTYDDIKFYVFTDNYEDVGGKNMITGSVPLGFASDAPNSVTIPANGEKEITFNIKLDSNQTAENMKIFTNGFWVDGFVVLGSKDGSVQKTSMPFTGFYGDWTAMNSMVPSYFEEGEAIKNGGISLYNQDNGTYTILGTNKFVKDANIKGEYESEDYVGLSVVKSGNYYLRIYALRSLVGVTLTVKDSSGEIVRSKMCENGLSRLDEERGYMSVLEFGGADLPEGDYSLTLSGRLAYDSDRSKTEEKTFKFYVDSSAPTVGNTRVYEEDGKKYAAFEASDNRYLMGAEAKDGDGGYASKAVKAEKETEIVLDITDLDEESLELTVYDYAHNETSFRMDSVVAEIVDTIKDGDDAAFIASVTNNNANMDADVIMALYSEDGRLVGVKKQNALIKSGVRKVLAFSFTGAIEAAQAKLFIWRHGQMTPVTEAVVETDL